MASNKLMIFCLSLLVILLIRIFLFYQTRPSLPLGEGIAIRGNIISEPVLKGEFQSFQLQLSDGNLVFVTALLDRDYHFQDSIIISSLEKRLLNNNREIYTSFLPQITVVKKYDSGFLAITNFVRQKIIETFNSALSLNQAALLLGIVFGIRTELSGEFLSNLRTAGVFHVVAASGMNVTLVGGFISSIAILLLKRQHAIVLTILGLLFYALLAGFQPSITRATIMGCLVFSSQILGRQYLASYALYLTAFIILFVSPFLLFDIGFQLSFLATLGLLYIRPIIDLIISKALIRKFFIIEDFSTTLSAQILTLPVLLVNFGSYSLWSIAANLLVLWTIPILMVIGGLGVILSIIIYPLGKLVIFLTMPLLMYFEKIISIFPKTSGEISIVGISWIFVVSYYLILLSTYLWFKKLSNYGKENN